MRAIFARILVVSGGVAAAACGSPTAPTPTTSAKINPSRAPVITGGLRVDRAIVAEVPDSGPIGWHYAPQVRVTDLSGREFDPVVVYSAALHAPDRSVWDCSVWPPVVAGRQQPLELFPPEGGEYPITLGPFHRRLAGDWLIVVRFWDGGAPETAIWVAAPPEPAPGIMPPYSGGPIGGGWSCRKQPQ